VIKFLFWNLNGKPLEATVGSLARMHDIDVLMLAECAVAPARMLRVLNDETDRPFHLTFSLLKSIAVYTRFSRRFVRTLGDDEAVRLTSRRFVLPARLDILLVVVHLPSKLRWKESSQSVFCPVVTEWIRQLEDEVGHTRTVIAGDFNMNPFETGVVSATGFNATMARDVAVQGTRSVLGRDYPFFYNPMWALSGDAGVGRPSGTYYQRRSEPVDYCWNMFDQVLVRPDLLPNFENEHVQILTADADGTFLSKKGRPRKKDLSDHLPIVFALNM